MELRACSVLSMHWPGIAVPPGTVHLLFSVKSNCVRFFSASLQVCLCLTSPHISSSLPSMLICFSCFYLYCLTCGTCWLCFKSTNTVNQTNRAFTQRVNWSPHVSGDHTPILVQIRWPFAFWCKLGGLLQLINHDRAVRPNVFGLPWPVIQALLFLFRAYKSFAFY